MAKDLFTYIYAQLCLHNQKIQISTWTTCAMLVCMISKCNIAACTNFETFFRNLSLPIENAATGIFLSYTNIGHCELSLVLGRKNMTT